MPYGKIIYVEKCAKLRRLFSEYMEHMGLEVFSTSIADSFAWSESENADIAVFSDEIEDCAQCIAELRSERGIPVIVTISRNDRGIPAELMESGMAEYIRKPFDMAKMYEMMVRLLPDKTEAEPYGAVEFAGLRVDICKYEAAADGEVIDLSPKELELLYLLISAPDTVRSSGELSSRVWGRVITDSKTLTVHINRLRRKLGAYGKNLCAVRNVGYVWRSEP